MAQDLEAAYALQTPDDSRRLYRDWAGTYDDTFANAMDYAQPAHVADLYAQISGALGPVLDMGAGTGLCGQALKTLGVAPIDATDISQEMLDEAARKKIYDRLFTGNLLDRLPVEDGTYAGAVSSGTFTHGHVGPEALAEVIRILRPGGLAVIAVHEDHWRGMGFAAVVDTLPLSETGWREARIYGDKASGPHADARCRLLWMRKAPDQDA